MDNIEKLKREIRAMDKNKKNELLDALDAALSDAQKQKLKKMLTDKKSKTQLEKQLNGMDINDLLSNTASKDEMLSYISRPDVKNKINDIFG